MLHLMKRDYYVIHLYMLVILLAIPFIYIAQISSLFAYVGIMMGFIFNVFYYEGHNHVSRYIVSVPVSKSQIVLSRYMFLVITATLLLLYIWFIDILAHYLSSVIRFWSPDFTNQPITFQTVLFLFMGILVIASITIPIYYICQSVIKALLIQSALLFIGAIIGAFAVALFGPYIPESVITEVGS